MKKSDMIKRYKKQLESTGIKVNMELLNKITDSLSPGIFKADAETVSSSDPSELKTIKDNYLIKKLGLKDSKELDESIESVIKKLGKSNKSKYRVCFYYLLCEEFNKESEYIENYKLGKVNNFLIKLNIIFGLLAASFLLYLVCS